MKLLFFQFSFASHSMDTERGEGVSLGVNTTEA